MCRCQTHFLDFAFSPQSLNTHVTVTPCSYFLTVHSLYAFWPLARWHIFFDLFVPIDSSLLLLTLTATGLLFFLVLFFSLHIFFLSLCLHSSRFFRHTFPLTLLLNTPLTRHFWSPHSSCPHTPFTSPPRCLTVWRVAVPLSLARSFSPHLPSLLLPTPHSPLISPTLLTRLSSSLSPCITAFHRRGTFLYLWQAEPIL